MMTESSQPESAAASPLICPECDAPHQRGTVDCWLCGRAYESEELDGLASESPEPVPLGSFSLSTMMLTITLVSVCLGVLTIQPGVGLALSLLAFVAFVATSSRVEERKGKGKTTSAREKVTTFFAALGLTVLVGIASIGSFAATCAVGLNSAMNPSPDILVILAFMSPLIGFAVLIGAVVLAEKHCWFRD